MPKKPPVKQDQIAIRKSETALVTVPDGLSDSLSWWVEQYFKFEVTTAASSQEVQRRDLARFVRFVEKECGSDSVRAWTPRLARAFQDALRKQVEVRQGKTAPSFSDRTINRMMAHLKTFAKWVHKLKPFPLGDPTEKIALLSTGNGLEVERAVSTAERRKLLDAADLLLRIGGESKDRNRYGAGERPKRKGYRPYRNRAIIYCLLETGMRRAAVRNLELSGVNVRAKALSVREKGGNVHSYQISSEGLQAIQDYIERERGQDTKAWESSSLFLPASTIGRGSGRLTACVINTVWNDVAKLAGVEKRTPHSARHAMGRHLIEKTGNIAAVQRQLGHKNAAYSMQYTRITAQELASVLEDR